MSMIVPPSVVEPFCADGTAGTDYTVIPVPTQIAVSPELASFSTGFPPATRLAKTAGGIPPRGKDMNGILRMATAHTAWVAAGGRYPFNSDVVSIRGGYPVGAVIQSNTNPLQCFLNMVANNTNDPNSVLTGWVSSIPIYSASTVAGGTYTDQTLPGRSDYILDINTSTGNVTFNGFVAQRDGQRVTVNAVGAGNITFGFLAGTPGNQIRASGASGSIVQNDSFTLQYCQSINSGQGAWLVI